MRIGLSVLSSCSILDAGEDKKARWYEFSKCSKVPQVHLVLLSVIKLSLLTYAETADKEHLHHLAHRLSHFHALLDLIRHRLFFATSKLIS